MNTPNFDELSDKYYFPSGFGKFLETVFLISGAICIALIIGISFIVVSPFVFLYRFFLFLRTKKMKKKL